MKRVEYSTRPQLQRCLVTDSCQCSRRLQICLTYQTSSFSCHTFTAELYCIKLSAIFSYILVIVCSCGLRGSTGHYRIGRPFCFLAGYHTRLTKPWLVRFRQVQLFGFLCCVLFQLAQFVSTTLLVLGQTVDSRQQTGRVSNDANVEEYITKTSCMRLR